jgi:pSer/pThr/pTyr-binding forkhead associated (FHA) protein
VIDNLAVDPVHARIQLTGDKAILIDNGEEKKILVNGVLIQNQHELQNGDSILIGKHTIQYASDTKTATQEESVDSSVSQPETKTSQYVTAWIQFLNGSKMGKTIKLDKPFLRIGKTGQTGAMISSRDNGYFISHLEGEGVVKVGDKEIGDNRTLLKNGDTIQIGELSVMFFTE